MKQRSTRNLIARASRPQVNVSVFHNHMPLTPTIDETPLVRLLASSTTTKIGLLSFSRGPRRERYKFRVRFGVKIAWTLPRLKIQPKTMEKGARNIGDLSQHLAGTHLAVFLTRMEDAATWSESTRSRGDEKNNEGRVDREARGGEGEGGGGEIFNGCPHRDHVVGILWSVSNRVITYNGIKRRRVGYRRILIVYVLTLWEKRGPARGAINIDVCSHYRISFCNTPLIILSMVVMPAPVLPIIIVLDTASVLRV